MLQVPQARPVLGKNELLLGMTIYVKLMAMSNSKKDTVWLLFD